MGTTKNTLYKVKASPVPTIVGLNLESGAIVFDQNDSKIKGCDGSVWADLGVSGGSYSFVNGLTESGGIVELGGTLTKDTIIEGAEAYDFKVQGTESIFLKTHTAQPYAYIQLGNSTSTILQMGSSSSQTTRIFIRSDEMQLRCLNGSIETSVILEIGAGIQLRDDTTLKGAVYYADYSANFTDRSLVDKAYVDSAGGAWSSQVQTADVFIDGANTYKVEFDKQLEFNVWTNTGYPTYPAAYLHMGTGVPVAEISAFGGDGLTYGRVLLRSNSAELICRASGNTTAIQVRDTEGIEVTDDGGSKGMYYDDDYSANYTPRSIVDLAYIQANFVAI